MQYFSIQNYIIITIDFYTRFGKNKLEVLHSFSTVFQIRKKYKQYNFL